MKHKAQQFELGWTSEPFALIQEQATDFDRIQAEKEQVEKVKAEALQQYMELPTTSSPADFLKGHGNWGLTEDEYNKALKLARVIEK